MLEITVMKEETTEIIAPFSGSALDYFQSIYRDASQEQHTRMRAAALAIAYESPKLMATAIMEEKSFANLLDRARLRSEKVRVIEARPLAEPKEAAKPEIKPYLPTVPDRRYRRI
jgi:hypothetical protein